MLPWKKAIQLHQIDSLKEERMHRLAERRADVYSPSFGKQGIADPSLADDSKRKSQEAGLNALVAIASVIYLEGADEATALLPVIAPEQSRVPQGLSPLASVEKRGASSRRFPLVAAPWAKLHTLIRGDHMVRNSLYLIVSSGLQAALGFAFWIVAARLFTTAEVGTASSLISAMGVISYLGLLGLNNTFDRYLPTARNRDQLITAGLSLVALCGAAVGLIYVLLIPILAPHLSFVEQRPALAAGFVAMTAASTANLLTDSVFISSRRAGLCTTTDGAVGGITKLICAVALGGTGAFGLFFASASGFAAAALASVILIAATLHWRPSFSKMVEEIKPVLRFSGANYIGNILNMLPILVVPIIVLDRLGSSTAAYYFVAFQVALLLYSTAYAVGQTSLTEGSQAGVDWRQVMKRSRRVLAVLCVPACLLLALAAHWIMLVFGARYSQHGTTSLIVLAIAAVPMGANNWLLTKLRLEHRLQLIVWSNAVYAAAICGLAWVLAPYGLTALTAAWPVGCLLGSVVAAVPRRSLGRHRRAV